jgi:lysozyme family protein
MSVTGFDKCLPLLFDDEGGYCNDAHDSGGPTKWGITHYDLAEFLGKKSVSVQEVKDMTKAIAAKIYKNKYWKSIHGDELPDGVDYAVFDYAVNSGISRAVKVLQKIVGVKQDGIVGGMTIDAVKRMDPEEIINKLCDQRLSFLQSLKIWKYFGKGWKRRVLHVHSDALLWAKASKLKKKNGNLSVSDFTMIGQKIGEAISEATEKVAETIPGVK